MSQTCANAVPPSSDNNRRSQWELRLIFVVAFGIAISSPPAWSQVATTRPIQVAWPNPEEGKSNLQAILSKKRGPSIQIVPAELATVKLPVLVPEQLFDFDSLLVGAIPDGNQYYANAKSAGLLVLVGGSRIVHEVPQQSPSSKVFAAPTAARYKVTRTESGFSLGLTRYGVPYSITTDCRQTDKRCTEPYIRSLADRMIFIGGEP